MYMKRRSGFTLVLVLFVLITTIGCSGSAETITLPAPTITAQGLQFTATPTRAPTPQPSPTPTATIEPVRMICSPLQDIEPRDLHKITSQGFTPPAPFEDNGHPAVDLAFYTYKEMPSMIGHPVQSIFPGTVSLVIDDRYPYGNAIMIETPLELISNELLGSMTLPTPIPQENLDLLRPCDSNPIFENIVPLAWSEGSKSIYLLYAHLLEKPGLVAGESVSCGQVVGAVGSSGNSAEEHLHLEARVGPASAKFGNLAMYSPDATIKERYSYCIWTSSGRFQTFNPVMLWEQEP